MEVLLRIQLQLSIASIMWFQGRMSYSLQGIVVNGTTLTFMLSVKIVRLINQNKTKIIKNGQ